MKGFIHIFYLLVFLITCPTVGQVSSESAIRREYLAPGMLNEKAGYLTYRINTRKESVLVLQNFISGEELRFEKVSKELLIDKHLIYLDREQNLILLNLIERRSDTLGKARSFDWIKQNNSIIFLNHTTNELKSYHVAKGAQWSLSNVLFYSKDDDNKKLVAVGKKDSLTSVQLSTGRKKTYGVNIGGDMRIKKILFRAGETYALSNSRSMLSLHRLGTQLDFIYGRELINHSEGTVIDTIFSTTKIIADGNLALKVREIAAKSNDASVEIWSTLNKEHDPGTRARLKYSSYLAIADWTTGTWTSFYGLGKLNDYRLSADEKCVFATDIVTLDNGTEQFPKRRISLYGLKGNLIRDLGVYNGNNFTTQHFAESPDFFYYDGIFWNRYNLVTQKKHRIMGTDFEGKPSVEADEEFEYKKPVNVPILIGSKHLSFKFGKNLYLYGLKDHSMVQLAKDRLGIRNYSLSQSDYDTDKGEGVWNPYNKISHSEYFVLQWHTDFNAEEGLSILKRNGEIVDLVFDAAQYYSVKRFGNKLLYIKEKYNMPPVLCLLDVASGKEQIISKSNLLDTEVSKRFLQYHQWKTEKGADRGAIVHFPDNYKEGQKYPVIVDLYEKKYKQRNAYLDPYDLNDSGISYRNLTAAGYFIVEPDLYYEVGNPGLSAYTCVKDAVNVLSSRITGIDTERMGLFGHSFGAYETNFIITQTDIFKAAVSWSGIADMVGSYFSYNESVGKTEFWKYESQQYRMGSGYYDSPENYYANSPLQQACKIKTPLLLITGTEDDIVSPLQSKKMFLALQRQQKEVKLLLYKGEGHSIHKEENKKDVSHQIKSWFDKHLTDNENIFLK